MLIKKQQSESADVHKFPNVEVDQVEQLKKNLEEQTEQNQKLQAQLEHYKLAAENLNENTEFVKEAYEKQI